MADNAVSLPQGFVLDTQPSVANTGIPAGFVMDTSNPQPSFFDRIKRPFVTQGATAAEALNKGMASFSTGAANVGEYIGNKIGVPGRSELFDKAAQTYTQNADYWHNIAQKEGANKVDELMGEAVGGAVPGVGEFLLGVPYATLRGAADAAQKGDSEAAGALKEGMKRFVLGKSFEATSGLTRPLQAGAMGLTFGAQAAGAGGNSEDVAKAAGTGILYGATGPRGEIGLKDIAQGLKVTGGGPKTSTSIPETETPGPAEEAAQVFQEQGNVPSTPAQYPVNLDRLKAQYSRGETGLPETTGAEEAALPQGFVLDQTQGEVTTNAEEVRSNQEVPQAAGRVGQGGQVISGPNLQQPAEAGATSGEPIQQIAQQEVIPSGSIAETAQNAERQEAPEAGKEELVTAMGPSAMAAPVTLPKFAEGQSEINSGSQIQLGKSPAMWTVTKELEPTDIEKTNGERYFEVKNNKTGEIQTIERADIRGQKPRNPLMNESGAIINPIETIRQWRESNKPDEALKQLRDQYVSDLGDIDKKKKSDIILTGKAAIKNLMEPDVITTKDITDAKLANLIMQRQHYKDVQWKLGENRRKWWDKEPNSSRYAFMVAVDQGGKLPGEIGGLAQEYRGRLDKVFGDETAAGLDLNYLKDYFPRDWEQPDKVTEWLNQKLRSMGTDKYTKERYYDLMKDALKMGLRLKESNPETAILKREFSANRAITGEQFMQGMKDAGLAVLETEKDKQDTVGQLAMQTTPAWSRVTLNGKNWLVNPDVGPLMKNALFSESLYNREDILGSAFRGFQKVKNTLIPIKLGLSGFHLLHIGTMTAPQRRAAIYEYLIKGGKPYDGMVKELVASSAFVDQGFKKGNNLVKAWEQPDGTLSEYDKQAVQYMQEGGFSPKMSEVWRMKASEEFGQALREGKYATAGLKGARALLDATQKPIFETYIPAIKTAAYTHEVDLLLKRKPELMNDADARGVELRKIAKSIDNRFGELNYSTLFWNKYLKEIGIASSLSMGWNLGFLREYGGAAVDTAKAARNLLAGRGSTEDITRRMLFTLDYTIQSAVIGGLITAGFLAIRQNMSWDKIAESLNWKDFLYPRTGDANLDGSTERMNTPFYTKEFPAMAEHVRKEGVIGGAFGYLRNKSNPIITSLANVWQNKDFYGQEIYSDNDPAIQKSVDVAKYLAGEAGPISLTSYKAAKKTGSAIEYTSFAGFAKAPGYITKTPMQNEIGDIYNKRFGGGTKPKEDKEKDDAKKEIKELYYQGKDDEANAKLDAAVDKGYIKERGVNAFISALDVPTDIMLFKRLGEPDQTALIKKMGYDDLKRYVWYANQNVRDNVESLNKNGAKLLKLYDAGLIKEPEWSKGKDVANSSGRSMSGEVEELPEEAANKPKIIPPENKKPWESINE